MTFDEILFIPILIIIRQNTICQFAKSIIENACVNLQCDAKRYLEVVLAIINDKYLMIFFYLRFKII